MIAGLLLENKFMRMRSLQLKRARKSSKKAVKSFTKE